MLPWGRSGCHRRLPAAPFHPGERAGTVADVDYVTLLLAAGIVCPQTYVVRSQLSRVGQGTCWGPAGSIVHIYVLGHEGEVFMRPPRVPHFPLRLGPAGMLIAVPLMDTD